MIDIIQIYRSKEIFEKSFYTPENRKYFFNIYDTIDSVNGYFTDHILHLPVEYKNHPDIKTAKLIIIQDMIGFNPFMIHRYQESLPLPDWFIRFREDYLYANNQLIYMFSDLSSPKSFEIFRFEKSNSNKYDLYIDYNHNSLTIGNPKRENHKICELKRARPIRYKINGRSDYSMSGERLKAFREFDYIMEWKGQVDKIEFLELNKIKTTKQIPIKECKLIDERKKIY